MRIALDAMGGDTAPLSMVLGAMDFTADFPDAEVILVGQEDTIAACCKKKGLRLPDAIRVEHAPEVIGMADKIAALREKPNDSMNTAAKLVKNGTADAMVLCGNTGCSVASAQLHLRRIKGVARAGILTPMPTVDKGTSTWVIDCGANAVGKPEHLVQFAEMASVFLQEALQIDSPRVGILSIGSEDGKGTELTTETLALLRDTTLNCIGNVEGNDIFKGCVDIVVCDGFTGNVMLKTAEGCAAAMGTMIKEELFATLRTKIGAFFAKPAFKQVKKRSSWAEVGGCVLLGVDGITIIGHGRSDSFAVYHALRQAERCVRKGTMNSLRNHFKPPA